MKIGVVDFIVVHCNGYPERTAKDIDRVHKARGWDGIGYHWVLEESGLWHRGRPESVAGAGVRGLNKRAIHVCVIGDFNDQHLSHLMRFQLLSKLAELQSSYQKARVIGHREVNSHLAPRFHTRKSCPGRNIDLDELREQLREVRRDGIGFATGTDVRCGDRAT